MEVGGGRNEGLPALLSGPRPVKGKTTQNWKASKLLQPPTPNAKNNKMGEMKKKKRWGEWGEEDKSNRTP